MGFWFWIMGWCKVGIFFDFEGKKRFFCGLVCLHWIDGFDWLEKWRKLKKVWFFFCGYKGLTLLVVVFSFDFDICVLFLVLYGFGWVFVSEVNFCFDWLEEFVCKWRDCVIWMVLFWINNLGFEGNHEWPRRKDLSSLCRGDGYDRSAVEALQVWLSGL